MLYILYKQRIKWISKIKLKRGKENVRKVREEIIKFNQDRDWDQFHSPENLAKSIAIESGELLECFQWDNSFNKQDVCDELADVVNYCIWWLIS